MVKRLMGRGRSDDNEETIKKRFRVNKRDAEPVVTYYDKEKKLVRVNCNDTPEGTFPNCCTNLRGVYTNPGQNPSNHRRMGKIRMVHHHFVAFQSMESIFFSDLDT